MMQVMKPDAYVFVFFYFFIDYEYVGGWGVKNIKYIRHLYIFHYKFVLPSSISVHEPFFLSPSSQNMMIESDEEKKSVLDGLH